MKKIRKVLIVTLILSLTLPFSAFAFNFSFSSNEFPEPTNNFFVNDFANVIDDEVEIELQAIGEDIYKQTTAQIVVVTVDSLDGYAVEDYALELGREWGVGSAEADNGVVLLMSVNDRQVTIQVGYGLEGCLPDGKTGGILDTYAVPHLRNDNFSTGLANAYKAIANVVCVEYGIELDNLNVEDYKHNYDFYNEDEISTVELVIVFIIIFLTISLFVFIILKNNGDGSNHGGGSYNGGAGRYYGGFVIQSGNHHSGGYRGGGGSFGGGGFRGGGGSFGGGGSSRGF